MTLLRRNAPLSRIFVVTPVLDVGPEKVGELVVLVFGEEGCDFGSDYFFRARGAEIVPGDLVEGLQVLLANWSKSSASNRSLARAPYAATRLW